MMWMQLIQRHVGSLKHIPPRYYSSTASMTQMMASFAQGTKEQRKTNGYGLNSRNVMLASVAAAACAGSFLGYQGDEWHENQENVAWNEAAAPEEKKSPTGLDGYSTASVANKRPKLHGLKIFSGNANRPLASNVAELVGVELGKVTVERFADGEVNVMVHENVRGKDVYIIQPTCVPVNENLMELMLMVSTMRRASARRITAVIPYYGYARQDRKMTARVPISAADVARLLEAMGVDRVIAVDLHCGQIQGFFGPRVPVDNLDGGLVGVPYFGQHELVNPVVVSPDAGGVARAKKFREWLISKHGLENTGLAMIVKQRVKANEIEKMDLVGDVKGKDCIIVDDMIDTAGTLCKAAQHLTDHGARNVYAFASHGLFNGPASDRIAKSTLKEVVVVNSTPLPASCVDNEKIKQLDIAPLLAAAIQNIHSKKSVSQLFN